MKKRLVLGSELPRDSKHSYLCPHVPNGQEKMASIGLLSIGRQGFQLLGKRDSIPQIWISLDLILSRNYPFAVSVV